MSQRKDLSASTADKNDDEVDAEISIDLSTRGSDVWDDSELQRAWDEGIDEFRRQMKAAREMPQETRVEETTSLFPSRKRKTHENTTYVNDEEPSHHETPANSSAHYPNTRTDSIFHADETSYPQSYDYNHGLYHPWNSHANASATYDPNASFYSQGNTHPFYPSHPSYAAYASPATSLLPMQMMTMMQMMQQMLYTITPSMMPQYASYHQTHWPVDAADLNQSVVSNIDADQQTAKSTHLTTPSESRFSKENHKKCRHHHDKRHSDLQPTEIHNQKSVQNGTQRVEAEKGRTNESVGRDSAADTKNIPLPPLPSYDSIDSNTSSMLLAWYHAGFYTGAMQKKLDARKKENPHKHQSSDVEDS
eukprot:TRINITY_DN6246_c0_g1_i1.p1 TRINITY_DN6246_c0_g1~~TRINITY_DN6246_c0_g1_i1.p1  ORF type:complete len:363 (-),score=94.08 TRINITY_DN6246_c0_g1_i1:303-1391(-)